MILIIGVRFRKSGKVYYFAPNGLDIKKGDHVIVETARGIEYGLVVLGQKEVTDDKVVQPLKDVIRIATESDYEICYLPCAASCVPPLDLRCDLWCDLCVFPFCLPPISPLRLSSAFQPISAAASCALRLLLPVPTPMTSPPSPRIARAVNCSAYSGPATDVW